MTDKQIIIDKDKFEKAENEPINQEAVNKFIEDTDKFYIDGVDVSGCPQYCGYDTCKNTCHYFCTPCEWVDIKNCNYKRINLQLQAKEQECEELNKTITNLENIRDKFSAKLDQLKAENEKLKQTFAQIKKLAGEYIEIYFPDYYDEGSENDVVTEFANKILQKISEMEDEKSNN